MKADPKYLLVLVLAMFGVLAFTGDRGGAASPSGPGVLLAAPQEEDGPEAERKNDREGEGPELRVIGLENQPARKAMETLEQLFKSDLFDDVRDKLALAVNGPANAIVVVGPGQVLDRLEGMLRKLDELTAEHHKRMKDREAEQRKGMKDREAEQRKGMQRKDAERRKKDEREDAQHREQVGKQMRRMGELMQRFFREYDRSPSGNRHGKPQVFEGPGFRFDLRPDIDRPKKVKKL